MDSVLTKEESFKELERKIYDRCLEVAREIIKFFLEKKDEELAEQRDKKELRKIDRRTRVVKTIMGEVEIKRSLYRRKKENGTTEYVYLLDEFLGEEVIGTVSANLLELIADRICEKSYRQTARDIEIITGQSISHQAIWDIVQKIGQRLEKEEIQKINSTDWEKESEKKKEVQILFEEADGLWLPMQGPDRPQKGSGRREMKLGIAYEGWEKRHPCSREYRTVGKIAYGGYMDGKTFGRLRDMKVAQQYSLDEIHYRILNGDGASWIRQGNDTGNEIFQLDPYHLSKAVLRSVRDKRARKDLLEWLKQGHTKKALERIENLKYECGGLADEVKKLQELEKYIYGNREGIGSYRDKIDWDSLDRKDGLEYRSLGTMERNVGLFGRRMSGPMSWSRQGATHLAKILALKISGKLETGLAGVMSGKLPELMEEKKEKPLLRPKDFSRGENEKKEYGVHRGRIPYENSPITLGRKAIRDLFNYREFGDMGFQ